MFAFAKGERKMARILRKKEEEIRVDESRNARRGSCLFRSWLSQVFSARHARFASSNRYVAIEMRCLPSIRAV